MSSQIQRHYGGPCVVSLRNATTSIDFASRMTVPGEKPRVLSIFRGVLWHRPLTKAVVHQCDNHGGIRLHFPCGRGTAATTLDVPLPADADWVDTEWQGDGKDRGRYFTSNTRHWT
jgi:hypothetical protein